MFTFKETNAFPSKKSSPTSGQPRWSWPAPGSEPDFKSHAARFKRCPELANPLLGKQLLPSRCTSTPGGEPDGGESTLFISQQGPVFIHRGQWSQLCLHCRVYTPPPRHWGVAVCRQHLSPLSVCHTSVLFHLAGPTAPYARNGLLLQFNAFFRIFSLGYISTVGSLCDNIINVLVLSWFFSHLPWRKKTWSSFLKPKLCSSQQRRQSLLLITNST